MSKNRLIILFFVLLLMNNSSTSSIRSGHYNQLCQNFNMTFNQSSLNIWLDEVQATSWKDCINHCLHHSKCASITFNRQTMNDNNCMLYSDETVSCIPGQSDTEITIKVGQLSTRSLST